MDLQVNIRHPQLFLMLARELSDRVRDDIEKSKIVPVLPYSGHRLQPAFSNGALKEDEVTSHVTLFSDAIGQKLEDLGYVAVEEMNADADFADFAEERQAFSEALVDLAAAAGAVQERCRQSALECADIEHAAERHRAVERLNAIMNKSMAEMSNELLDPAKWDGSDVDAQVAARGGILAALEARAQ